MQTRPTVHIEYLDGVRGLAALYVVLHHAFLQVWNYFDPAREMPSRSLAPLMTWMLYGRFAVDLFIVLSGYCLMLPVIRSGGVIRGGAMGFYGRRARRILPTFYAAVALSLALIATLIGTRTGTHWDVTIPVDWQSVASCLLMFQDVWRPSKINHVFWSIAVEWRIYFFLPALAWGWRKAGPVATTAVVVAAVLLASGPMERLGLGAMTVHYLALFTFGMLAATIAMADSGRLATIRDRLPWGTAAAALGALMVGVCSWKGIDTMVWRWPRYDFAVGIAWSLMLVFLALPRGLWLARLIAWRPLVFSGVIGYSLYLIHAPLLQVIQQYLLRPLGLPKPGEFALLATLGIPAIVAASAAFAHFFEPRRRVVVEVSTPDLLGAGPDVALIAAEAEAIGADPPLRVGPG